MSWEEFATEGWMPTEFLFILALHAIAALITVIMAIRDRENLLLVLRSLVLGFLTGFLGLVTRARLDRRHLHYMQVVQDAVLNLAMEVFALYVIPHFLM
jgi:hypothetical protein